MRYFSMKHRKVLMGIFGIVFSIIQVGCGVGDQSVDQRGAGISADDVLVDPHGADQQAVPGNKGASSDDSAYADEDAADLAALATMGPVSLSKGQDLTLVSPAKKVTSISGVLSSRFLAIHFTRSTGCAECKATLDRGLSDPALAASLRRKNRCQLIVVAPRRELGSVNATYSSSNALQNRIWGININAKAFAKRFGQNIDTTSPWTLVIDRRSKVIDIRHDLVSSSGNVCQ